jgi:putative nucleotidyltransferase with HDIG domain
MREWAPQLEHVSGERIGGGLAADGLGELSKLLLGRHPAKALRLARDAGVLLHLLPEFEPAVGYAQRSDRQHLTLDEHVFEVVQAAADAGVSLEVRLAALLHDLGKPEAERNGGDHAAIGAAIAARVLRRLRYPTKLRDYVVKLVREHPFDPEGEPSAVDARRFLARHGERLAFDLLAHRAADLAGKSVPQSEWEWLDRFRALVEQERVQPHRLADLEVDGGDLIEAGFVEGPELGEVLRTLLAEVVEEPGRNRRDLLLSRARELA